MEGNPKHVAVSADGLITPISEGTEKIIFRYGELNVDLNATVSSTAIPQANFVQDVQPVLSKMSCNAGTCHGAKDGKGGFQRSYAVMTNFMTIEHLPMTSEHVDLIVQLRTKA